MYAVSYVWAKVIARLEAQLTEVTVSTWFDDAEVIMLTDRELVVYSPSDFRQQILRDRCAPYIRDILQELLGKPTEFTVWGEHELRRHRQEKQPDPTVLNPQFTFSGFIPGDSNRLALGVAREVARQPGQERYNPFYLYGPPGVGKTHLLYAIANTLMERGDVKVTYIRAEQFTEALIRAIQTGDKLAFKQKFRQTDVLLVDDVQFIAGKEATQEEFFNTFNTLIEQGKQIVISSDRKPCDMPTLEERLRSRFESSVPIAIYAPDLGTRLAVVEAKAKDYGLTLDADTMGYIANRLQDNIRLVEGGMKKLRAYHELSGMALTPENVRLAIDDIRSSNTQKPVTEALVLRHVCKYYGLEESALTGTTRVRGILLPRQIAMYLIRKLVGSTLEGIGNRFGGKDHTTVSHSIRSIQNALDAGDEKLKAVLGDITANIEATPY